MTDFRSQIDITNDRIEQQMKANKIRSAMFKMWEQEDDCEELKPPMVHLN